MSHKDIASVAEPWIMLPFSYACKKEGVLAEYAHAASYSAIEDFINNLPHKEDDYYGALGTFANTLYEKQCLNEEKYFLDKTPRYYNIIPEIQKTFPEAKFIFLFRNPVHVMSSIIRTWSSGTFRNLYSHEQDLNIGPKALSNGYQLLKDKAYAIQYEEYVTNPSKYTKEICEFLEIKYDEDMMKNFSTQNTKGRMGDPTGINDYSLISDKSLEKWRITFDTTFRKRIVYRYLDKIEDAVLEVQGYNKKSILSEIEQLKVSNRNLIIDIIDFTYSFLIRYTKANIFFGKNTKKWAKGIFLS